MKNTILFLLACICFIAIGGRAMAQDSASMKKWMDYMTPGAMHKMLATWDGKWAEDVTVWMAPGQPPMKSTGTAENKMILGGRYQQTNITGSFGGAPYEAQSIMGYDNMKKVFFYSGEDNMGTGILNLEGTYDAATKTITLTGTELEPISGKDVTMRETIKIVDANTQVIDMYNVADGKETKIMEITGKRM